MSKFDSVWRSLDETIASGWAPGLVAGALAALLIDDGVFALDDAVEQWLPELARPAVLVDPSGSLDETVPADRPITVGHLLTLTHGSGVIFGDTPLSRAVSARGIMAGPVPPQMSADEYLARVTALPLAFQPGERWMYNTGSDILSILLARAATMPLHDLLAQRITGPLGMGSTGFRGGAADLPTAYVETTDGFEVFDTPDGPFSKTPPFETLAGGLVSTVPDYLRLLTALADDTLLPVELKKQMTSDQLTTAQRTNTAPMLNGTTSWGWQVGVVTEASVETGPGQAAGSYGWTGGTGTMGFVDPANDLIGVVFTQRLMSGPDDGFDYFTEPIRELI